MHVRIGIGLCVLRMLEIFSGGRRLNVDGDDSRVVVTVGKLETAIHLKSWRRRWRKPVNVVTPYKNCITGHGSTHGMHSVKVEAHRRYALSSPKAELKIHVFLNVGHQRGCKVETSGTSVKINVFFS